MDQLRRGIDVTDRAHRKNYAATLGEKCFSKKQCLTFVRIPVPIQTTETRRGQRLVDRIVISDPRIAARHCRGILREFFRKLRIQQVCVTRSAAVMYQSNDRLQTESPNVFHAFVRPGPFERLQIIGSSSLPKNWVAEPAYTELRQSFEVF